MEDLKEMVMLQRQTNLEIRSPPPRVASPGMNLRTVSIYRPPNTSLGVMLFEDRKNEFDFRGIRIAGIRTNSLAAESKNVFMGDAIVAVNDVWCLESTYDEVIRILQEAGDTVVLSVAGACDVDKPGSKFWVDSDESSSESTDGSPREGLPQHLTFIRE